MEYCGPSLSKYLKKKNKENSGGGAGYEQVVAEHSEPSSDDFETADTLDDPLEDHEGAMSKKATSSLAKYEKLKKYAKA